MAHISEETVAFRLWPPVAIGAPLLAGWVVTGIWGDPVDLGGWRLPAGWALALFFVVWNGWSLWLGSRPRRSAGTSPRASDVDRTMPPSARTALPLIAELWRSSTARGTRARVRRQ
jgi:hypothetical protein